MSFDFHGAITSQKLVLDRIRPEHNERRFYALSTGVDLFGKFHLFRNWGRIGTGGRICFDVCAGAEEAMLALQKLAQAKRRRGYQMRASRVSAPEPAV
jgi:predicted DNA-binding WGR domain protein